VHVAGELTRRSLRVAQPLPLHQNHAVAGACALLKRSAAPARSRRRYRCVDAGKFKHCLVVRPRGGIESRPFLFPVTREGFEKAEEFILRASGGVVPEDVLVGIEFAGVYGHTLAHYLHTRGYQVVSVPPAFTKAGKKISHSRSIKTDAKDAITITMLVGKGSYRSFAFLKTSYMELRHLVSTRERLTSLRGAAITRLKSSLQVLWPEFESVFGNLKKTAVAVLRAYSGPDDLLASRKSTVIRLLREISRNHRGEATYTKVKDSAESTLGLTSSTSALKGEVRQMLKQIAFYSARIKEVEAVMVTTMEPLPDAQALLTIPGVAPGAAATFLGSIDAPQSYHWSRQVLALAGLSLTTNSSGQREGRDRVSKEGRPLIRRLAFMLGLRAVRTDGLYRAQYEGLLKRNGGRKLPAVVAIGRKILRLMYSVARAQRVYTVEPPQPREDRGVSRAQGNSA
jgi:transposase